MKDVVLALRLQTRYLKSKGVDRQDTRSWNVEHLQLEDATIFILKNEPKKASLDI